MSQILPYQLEPEYPSSEEREDQESEEEQDEQDDSLVSNTGRRLDNSCSVWSLTLSSKQSAAKCSEHRRGLLGNDVLPTA
ncbi:hypothetical protein OS493_021755 [Desmophyllum pertusum]|uniref:Uncharacterized protein n=1 Tax=Desmophyllum pertusum TaxID=174260 RepID=A0A9X0A3E5_9CNID|nr:hypothetical protein OS493_021755 [Desmophyllum pertusum]